MNGIILIDKPQGWTSFDVVAKIRGLVKKETGQKRPKVGHAGTLDPLATGLLLVLVGTYCKRANEFSKLTKVYEVEVKLGEVSTTYDEEGAKTLVNPRVPSEKDILVQLATFEGKTLQIPPIFSAVKVEGKRAYKQARAGKEVIIKPREVEMHIHTIVYDYPFVRFTASVSSGTYIRSLAHDLGQKLGTGAYMSNLRRTEVGEFSISDAIPVTRVELETHLTVVE